jgi:hypothetical protein
LRIEGESVRRLLMKKKELGDDGIGDILQSVVVFHGTLDEVLQVSRNDIVLG